MSRTLASEACQPCSRGSSPLMLQEARELLSQLPEWELTRDGTALHRRFKFKSYMEALEFVQKVSVLAEAENHHPDVRFGWGYAELELTTHSIGGLHRNDFIIASRINGL